MVGFGGVLLVVGVVLMIIGYVTGFPSDVGRVGIMNLATGLLGGTGFVSGIVLVSVGLSTDRIEVALKVMRPSKISPDGRLEPMRPTTASGDRKPAEKPAVPDWINQSPSDVRSMLVELQELGCDITADGGRYKIETPNRGTHQVYRVREFERVLKSVRT